MSPFRAVGLAALAVLLVACQGPSTPPQGAEGPLARAAASLARGEYQQAADLYRQAVGQDATSVPAHFGLGVASSYLDRRDDTRREFEWVVQNGTPGSSEVVEARRWLASLGGPGTGPEGDVATQASAAAADRESRQRQSGNASLQGRAFVAVDRDVRPANRHLLMLQGQPKSPTSPSYSIRADEEGNFIFPNVTPGVYLLTDTIGNKAKATWRLRVDVQPSQEIRLDLNPGNSIKVRDDFPNQE